jgi:hypothetical protein
LLSSGEAAEVGVFSILLLAFFPIAQAAEVYGTILDSETGKLLPARLYIQSSTGEWFHAESQSTKGSSVPYSRIRGNGSVEVHTSLSAHAFVADLPPGHYTLTAERGKEYLAASMSVTVTENGIEPGKLVLSLHRWIHMAY